MKRYLAKSYQDVYSIVSEIKQRHFQNSEMWFRGQGVNKYLLKPSLFRTKDGIAKEREIFYEYRRLVTGLGLNHDNEWKVLIDMQHYGIPTRLLDWTSSLGVALYFAMTSAVEDYPMSLYIMNPHELNKLSSKPGIPILPNESKELSYVKNYIDKEPFPAIYPIAVKCDEVNDRVKAQRGMFTIHGEEKTDEDIDIIADLLEEKSAIYKIDISSEAKSSIKEYLEINGINDYTIFPDLLGIARHLRGLM